MVNIFYSENNERTKVYYALLHQKHNLTSYNCCEKDNLSSIQILGLMRLHLHICFLPIVEED